MEEVLEEIEDDLDAPQPGDPPNRIRRYGLLWKPLHVLMRCDPRFLARIPEDVKEKWYDFYIELWCLRKQEKIPGYRGYEHHFMSLTMIVWGDPTWHFSWQWNPNAVKMLHHATVHKFLGIAGSASSGKSMFGMLWGLTKWIINPEITKVFITSTTLEDSRGRIWGDVERYWLKFSEFFLDIPELLPGDLVSSKGYIRSRIDGKKSQKAGVALIAGAKGQEKDSAKKIGFKADNVIMIADELPILSEELYNAAKGNLFSNPNFQFIGIGNPTSKYDPFGIFVEPEEGWGTIDEHSEFWKTKLGWCLRFDGKKSPNVLAGREIWKNILTLTKYNEYRINLGEDSLEFWQMVRGFFSPTGRKDAIFWESDFEKYDSKRIIKEWVSMPVPCASLDPSFTHGGDRAVGTFGKVGVAQFDHEGKDLRVVLQVTRQVDYNKLVSKDANKSEEVVRLFGDDCEKDGVHCSNVSMDVSGGGAAFAPLLAQRIGNQFLKVNFGGDASDMVISKTDSRTGKERFKNAVTELWYIVKELQRTMQIAGLPEQTIVELCARDYSLVGKGIVQVEPKKDMIKRTGKSPDCGDSFVTLVDLCRKRHKLSSVEIAAKVPKKENPIPEEFQWGVKKKGKPLVKRTLSQMGTLTLKRNLSS